jgi:hypothetical protein
MVASTPAFVATTIWINRNKKWLWRSIPAATIILFVNFHLTSHCDVVATSGVRATPYGRAHPLLIPPMLDL